MSNNCPHRQPSFLGWPVSMKWWAHYTSPEEAEPWYYRIEDLPAEHCPRHSFEDHRQTCAGTHEVSSCVFDQLYDSHQSACRSGHSQVTALLKVMQRRQQHYRLWFRCDARRPRHLGRLSSSQPRSTARWTADWVRHFIGLNCVLFVQKNILCLCRKFVVTHRWWKCKKWRLFYNYSDVCHRMAILRLLYSVTFNFILKIKQFKCYYLSFAWKRNKCYLFCVFIIDSLSIIR